MISEIRNLVILIFVGVATVNKIIEGTPGQPPNVLVHFDGLSLLILSLLSLSFLFCQHFGNNPIIYDPRVVGKV